MAKLEPDNALRIQMRMPGAQTTHATRNANVYERAQHIKANIERAQGTRSQSQAQEGTTDRLAMGARSMPGVSLTRSGGAFAATVAYSGTERRRHQRYGPWASSH